MVFMVMGSIDDTEDAYDENDAMLGFYLSHKIIGMVVLQGVT